MPGRIAVAVFLLGSFSACVAERTEMPVPIDEAKAMHVDSLMALPGVVSVGIGLDDAGQPAIVIGLGRTQTTGDPELPTSLEGHPVVVRVIGDIRAR